MSTGAATAGAAAGSRLRIGHVLAWTAACAVGIAACRASHPPFNPRFGPVGDGVDAVMGAVFGTFLAGTGLMLLRRWRGERPGPEAPPGCWLLPFGLAAALADRAAVAAYYAVATYGYGFRPDNGAYAPPFLVVFRIAHSPGFLDAIHQAVGWGFGGLAALGFTLALWRRLRGAWIGVFVVFTGSALVLATWAAIAYAEFRAGRLAPFRTWASGAPDAYAYLVALCLAVMTAAVVLDRRRRSPTDGLHWAGVAAWLATGATQLVLHGVLR